MRLWKVVLFALVSSCMSLPLLAQSITFDNTDGMFSGTGLGLGNSLSLGNLTTGVGDSTLVTINGFTGNLAGYNTTAANLGTLSFSTGALTSGTMVPLSNQTSTFGPGGGFTVKDTFNGGYGGFTFSGTFSAESWACSFGANCKLITGTTNEYKGMWVFNGTLAAGTTLTIDGQTFMATTPGTVQFTAAGPNKTSITATVNSNGTISFQDAGGTTTFGGKFQISPEPGTLTLFGSGLIGVGLLAKYGRSKKSTGSTSLDS